MFSANAVVVTGGVFDTVVVTGGVFVTVVVTGGVAFIVVVTFKVVDGIAAVGTGEIVVTADIVETLEVAVYVVFVKFFIGTANRQRLQDLMQIFPKYASVWQ